MKLVNIVLKNYRGIKDETKIRVNNFCCIVGKNDVGKSTILKAVDAFLNDHAPSYEDKNIYNTSSIIEIELQFDCSGRESIIDESIPITFAEEELVNEHGLLCIKKKWDISQKTIKPKIYILRKKYQNDDFTLMTEKELISLCKKLGIDTQKGNGEQFNNKEKRSKLRSFYNNNYYSYKFDYEELPTTGQTRMKKILEGIKDILPTFEYFKADSSLSDSDTSVQKYFKDKAYRLLKERINTNDIEDNIRKEIKKSLDLITGKINSVLSAEEQISAKIDFDWSKLISTSFKCNKEEGYIPLNSRGDGFRRITMMSYFEMLAEEKNNDKSVIFGFEEPETFLHPETQTLLYNKLIAMTENGYQVMITTHAPNIVAETNIGDIIFVQKNGTDYILRQGEDISIQEIVEELGIKGDNTTFKVFDNVKLLFLVEGSDDVKAISHISQVYKTAGKIDKTLEQIGVLLVCIGGCDSLKHWTSLNIIRKLNKLFFILLDSDKKAPDDISPNLNKMIDLGYTSDNCQVTRKREIENYIPSSYFSSLQDPITINYSDWDDVKDICKRHAETIRLGGKKVCDKHFTNLSYSQLRSTLCPTDDDNDDEFLEIYGKLKQMII